MIYTERFAIPFKPIARTEAVVTAPGVRFTLLTARLIRLEYSPTESFEDRPSQVFWYREQPVPEFEVKRSNGAIQVETAYLRLHYAPHAAGFTPGTLSITLKESGRTWRYGDADDTNLLGTARTLDEADGRLDLEPGLLSRSGWAVVDDSRRLVFDEAGWLVSRDPPPGSQDLYFFGYGQEHHQALRDYFQVAGRVPMVPRWILGNWWSRYWAYSAGELLGLMHQFQDNQVPLSVCIVDMDWHITDTGNQSSGWTGYTWNRELFPDPPAFVEALHGLGLKTALNLHPALGVFPHEEQYAAMARWMDIDPSTETPVPFDIADPHFTQAYFEILHHPHEEQGIDFWWLDWQQGSASKVAGLDPLWWLNHLHFHDLGRNGEKRPFIFSRWGGLGNHRYPIGFSGDTVVSWDSLAFQPYFTATAANVGYGWWSHDIGGHMGGIEDAELYARWVQYGVFSPILRLHCTNNLFHERRPWGWDDTTFRVTQEAMQLRHALIPYLYSMAWRYHREAIAPVRPMYHDHPGDERAYHCPNQYAFGSELIAAPYLAPADPDVGLSRQMVWLPPGQWFHFFTGLAYPGDGWHPVYGDLDEIPVFAPAGAIVPLAPRQGWGGAEIPQHLEVHVFPGADGRFELYEDSGRPEADPSILPFSLAWESARLCFEIAPAQGETGHLPASRRYTIHFRGVNDSSVAVQVNGQDASCIVDYAGDTATLTVRDLILAPADVLAVTITGGALLAARDHRLPDCRRILRACRLDSWVKRDMDGRLPAILASPSLLAEYELALDEPIARALAEIITGAGVDDARNPAGGRRILLWNNRSTHEVTYKLLATTLYRTPVTQSGPLPPFAVLLPRELNLQWHLGNSPSHHLAGVADWLNTLAGRFRPETAGDLAAVCQFHFEGEGGRHAYATVSGQTLTVVEGIHPRPDVTVATGVSDWLALVNSQAAPLALLRAGRLQIHGDLTLLIQLMSLTEDTSHRRFQADRWRLAVTHLELRPLQLGA